MENLDEELEGKSVKEVTAFFASLLNIQGQLCLQKTEGLISVRTRLLHFYPSHRVAGQLRETLKQEVTLLFTPEEVRAIRSKLPEIDEEDLLHPLLTTILDQAYDVIQYNELTGKLMVEMAGYFLKKLRMYGYGETPQTLEFQERHERSQISLDKAIYDLRGVETVINNHLHRYPILVELPRLLRFLIQIKLGMLDRNQAPKLLAQITSKLGEYARARSAVAFDFNRLPSYQHGVRIRQSIILNLHKDILKYIHQTLQHEFHSVLEELNYLTSEIESASETLQPDSPEYQEMMQRKALLLKKLEAHRRRLDVVKCQEKLVQVQHKLVGDTIQCYNRMECNQHNLDEQIQAAKAAPEKPKPFKEHQKGRMFLSHRKIEN